MGNWYDIKRRLQQAVLPALFGCVIVYFGYHTVQGDNGLIAYARMGAQMERARIELAQLRSERSKLELRTNLMRSESLDPDMLDEQARWTLGLVHPNDVILRPER